VEAANSRQAAATYPDCAARSDVGTRSGWAQRWKYLVDRIERLRTSKCYRPSVSRGARTGEPRGIGFSATLRVG